MKASDSFILFELYPWKYLHPANLMLLKVLSASFLFHAKVIFCSNLVIARGFCNLHMNGNTNKAMVIADAT